MLTTLMISRVCWHTQPDRGKSEGLGGPSMERRWTQTQRVMGDVPMRDGKPRDIWDQHEAMLNALAAGDGPQAETLARRHILDAGDFMI